MGSVEGGCLVTVTGTGFAVSSLGDLTVDIDGIPCRVRKASLCVCVCVCECVCVCVCVLQNNCLFIVLFFYDDIGYFEHAHGD